MIDNLILKQQQNRLWSIFHLEDGFHQMHLHTDSQHLTAFQTPWGSYMFTVLPMGIRNGPAMFQRLICWILRGTPRAIAYIDDVLISTPQAEPSTSLVYEHYQDVCHTLAIFRKYSLGVKGVKVKLFRLSIKFCGQILSQGQRRAAPSKLQAIKDWKYQMITSVLKLKSFMGLAQ